MGVTSCPVEERVEIRENMSTVLNVKLTQPSIKIWNQ